MLRKNGKGFVDTVGLDTFPAFLRHYWLSKNKLIRQEYLFRALKEIIKSSIDVIELLDDLEKDAQLYNALTNSSDPFWIGLREAKKRIKELELFKERQVLPLLLAAYNALSTEEFSKTLRIVSIITFRYTVISGLNTNHKEQYYSQTAIKVSHGECRNAYTIAQELKPLYVSDLDFKNDFSTLSIKTKGSSRKLARYILFELENSLSQTDMDYEDNPATIEHILPENPDTEWSLEFPITIQENYIYRLGNYTLCRRRQESRLRHQEFSRKKAYLSYQSICAIEKYKRLTYGHPITLDRRQVRLADVATSVWRLSQLD